MPAKQRCSKSVRSFERKEVNSVKAAASPGFIGWMSPCLQTGPPSQATISKYEKRVHMKMQRHTGQVFYNNEAAGGGFLERAVGPDIRMTGTESAQTKGQHLAMGDWVEFDVIEGIDGPQARNIRLLETEQFSEEIVLFPLEVMNIALELDALQRQKAQLGSFLQTTEQPSRSFPGLQRSLATLSRRRKQTSLP